MVIQKKVEVIEKISFHLDHLKIMDVREEERERGTLSLPNQDEHFIMLSKCSVDCASFICDNKILFSAGYVRLWPGVVECWMIPSKNIKEYKLAFCRILKNYINDILNIKKYHRIQTVSPDDKLHARFMKFLGLKKEGVLRQYTHTRQDYCMYARIN